NINAVLLEDYVTGTGAGYAQANYYSGGGLGVMGGYEDLPNPVPAADMVYMDVARALPGGWGGVEGSLPDTVFAGESYSYAFTVALDESWDYDNMQIVGMLINNNSGEIENACVEDVITSILSITNNSELSVYPNPASEQVNIKSELTIETITVYNFAGQIVFAETVNNTNYRVNTSKLGAGIYLFQIETKEGRIAKRIIIE
ncbi:MAG: T9SS type A sorting domain-containing protein, partial [Bacteroidales bacterium]|nr:T9SS type A sorting domain-containing protein [Bacteroidales bacterium]